MTSLLETDKQLPLLSTADMPKALFEKAEARARAVVGELMKRIQGGTPEQREAIRERLLESLKR